MDRTYVMHKFVAQEVTLTESQDSMVPDIHVAEWSIMFYPTRAMLNHPDFWEMVKNQWHFNMEFPDYNYLPLKVDLSLLGVKKCPLMVILSCV